jgi:hypothetical protein
MRAKSGLPIFFLVIFLLVRAAASAATEITCPDSIRETSTVSINDEQWNVVANSGERLLERVGIYLGTLSEYGAQVPDTTKKSKLQEAVTWNIKRSPTDTFWIGCSFVGTSSMLFQKLDDRVTVCVASYDLLPSGKRQRLNVMDCR